MCIRDRFLPSSYQSALYLTKSPTSKTSSWLVCSYISICSQINVLCLLLCVFFLSFTLTFIALQRLCFQEDCFPKVSFTFMPFSFCLSSASSVKYLLSFSCSLYLLHTAKFYFHASFALALQLKNLITLTLKPLL